MTSTLSPVTPTASTGTTESEHPSPRRRLLWALQPHMASLVIVGLLIIVGAVFALLGPYLLGRAIDTYVADRDSRGLLGISALLAGTYLATWVAMTIYSRTMARIAQQVMYGLRNSVFANLQTLSLSFFDREPIGDLMSRTTNDVDAVDQLLSQNLIAIVQSVVSLVGIISFMLVLDWRLTAAALIPLLPMLLVTRYIGGRSRPLFRDYQQNLGNLNGTAEEQLSGQRVIIAFDHHDAARADFQDANEAVRDTGSKAQSLTVMLMPLTFGIGNLSVAMVAGLGGWLAIGGTGGVTVGLIASFVAYAQRIGQPLGRLGNTYTSIISALAGAERIFAIVDERPTVKDPDPARQLSTIAGRVVFTDVDFSYVRGSAVLTDINLTAETGQLIGLVGPTGAGKSTIVNLLTRFYDVDKGSITIDGIDIASIGQDSLREKVGVVLQDTFLFSESVRNNIRYGRMAATDDEVVQAAKLANADGFIRSLPNGYDTMLTEGATNLSLGQRQLLAIARTMISDPSILVLDEATSSVDTRTELAIQQALLRLMDGRTSFVIAHRLSTVRDADQILVVDAGRIVQRGTHDELVTDEGLYRELYRAQFKQTLGVTQSTETVDSQAAPRFSTSHG
ncbi:MAG: ABC transporter ATP-binding protein [Euzebya sp.]